MPRTRPPPVGRGRPAGDRRDPHGGRQTGRLLLRTARRRCRYVQGDGDLRSGAPGRRAGGGSVGGRRRRRRGVADLHGDPTAHHPAARGDVRDHHPHDRLPRRLHLGPDPHRRQRPARPMAGRRLVQGRRRARPLEVHRSPCLHSPGHEGLPARGPRLSRACGGTGGDHRPPARAVHRVLPAQGLAGRAPHRGQDRRPAQTRPAGDHTAPSAPSRLRHTGPPSHPLGRREWRARTRADPWPSGPTQEPKPPVGHDRPGDLVGSMPTPAEVSWALKDIAGSVGMAAWFLLLVLLLEKAFPRSWRTTR